MFRLLRALHFIVLPATVVIHASAANVSVPVFQPSTGNLEAPVRVTIRCATPDAEIHITTDGSEPTPRDTEVESGDAIVVDHPLTLKAKAWVPDGTASPTQVCVYHVRPSAGLASSFDDQSVPSFLAAGQTAKVSISIRNIGAATWVPNEHSLNPRKDKDARIWSAANVQLKEATPTWGVAVFDFVITAPAEPGTYNFQWRMHGPRGGFGEASPLKRISVVSSAEYQQLLASFASDSPATGTSHGAAATEEPRKKSPSLAGKTNGTAPRAPLPAGMAPGSEVARLFSELTRSPRSFRYLRTIGFNHSDEEFETIVSRYEKVFARTRIIRRDENGKRIVPGWPGVKLVRDFGS